MQRAFEMNRSGAIVDYLKIQDHGYDVDFQDSLVDIITDKTHIAKRIILPWRT